MNKIAAAAGLAWLVAAGCATSGQGEPVAPAASGAPVVPASSAPEAPASSAPVASAVPAASATPAASASGASEPPSREPLRRALQELREGGSARKDVAACQGAHDTARKLAAEAEAKGELDAVLRADAQNLYQLGARCLARADDCKGAWKLFQDGYPPAGLANVKDTSQRQLTIRMAFGTLVAACKDKAP